MILTMIHDIIVQTYDFIVYDIAHDMKYDISYDMHHVYWDITVHIMPMILYMILTIINYDVIFQTYDIKVHIIPVHCPIFFSRLDIIVKL